jgi:hypothetical protein
MERIDVILVILILKKITNILTVDSSLWYSKNTWSKQLIIYFRLHFSYLYWKIVMN